MKGLFLLIIFLFSAGLFAHESIDDRLDILEQDMRDIATRNPQGTLGASFATSRPEFCAEGWFVNFAVFYWHTKLGGTEYAYSLHPNFTQIIVNGNLRNLLLPQVHGDVKDNNFDWDYGLKVGVGYRTHRDSWDLFARYTYYNTDDTDSSTKPEPSALISLAHFELLVGSRVKSHVEVDYNNIELELARSYFVSQNLSFRPHIDIKSAWIDIDQNVVLTASSIANDNNTIGLDFKSKGDLDFWGLGPRVGVDSKWFIGCGFHLFGDVAGAILSGYFKTIKKQFVPPSLNPALHDGEAFRLKHKFHRFVPFAQMHLGLGWDTYLCHGCSHLGLKLGYEVQYYWRVNQLKNPDTFNSFVNQQGTQVRLHFEKSSEDLMFYGITGEARLDF